MAHRCGHGRHLTRGAGRRHSTEAGLASRERWRQLRLSPMAFSGYASRSHDSRLLSRGNTEPFCRSGNKSDVPAVW